MSSTQDYFDCPKCGNQAIMDQDNRTCEVVRFCTVCDWDGEDCERIQSYTKTLYGNIVQNYKLNEDGEYVCVSQSLEIDEDVPPLREDNDTGELVKFHKDPSNEIWKEPELE